MTVGLLTTAGAVSSMDRDTEMGISAPLRSCGVECIQNLRLQSRLRMPVKRYAFLKGVATVLSASLASATADACATWRNPASAGASTAMSASAAYTA